VLSGVPKFGRIDGYQNEDQSMPDPKFDDYEIEVIRFLAARFDSGTRTIIHKEFPRAAEVGNSIVVGIIRRLSVRGYLDWEDHQVFGPQFIIRPDILDLVHRLDNPPPVDHWENLTVWFKSKRWSLPLLVLFLGLPALYAWVQAFLGLVKLVFVGPTP
jgi:hypothetical protein